MLYLYAIDFPARDEREAKEIAARRPPLQGTEKALKRRVWYERRADVWWTRFYFRCRSDCGVVFRESDMLPDIPLDQISGR